jgi:hexosaminidase
VGVTLTDKSINKDWNVWLTHFVIDISPFFGWAVYIFTFVTMMEFYVLFLWLQIVFASNINLLPFPKEISWRCPFPRYVSESISLKVESTYDTQVVERAFARTMKSVFDLRFYPPVDDNHRTEDIDKRSSIRVNSDSEINTLLSSDPRFPQMIWTFDHLTPLIDTVLVTINNDVDLQLGVDESYTLDIGSVISIDANTTWGVLCAFQTLRQLILYQDSRFYINGSVTISDGPLFPHRGIMIDTSRNFIPVEKLKEQISIMSLCKLNSVHLHLTDTQSWPIEIQTYPDMTNDAYSSNEIYSVQDIAELIAFARDRGVRIIPEIDMPGHSRAGWRHIDPEMVICGDTYWNCNRTAGLIAVEPGPGQLNILHNSTYDAIEKVYHELSSRFLDDVFHVGMDELNLACYKTHKETNDYLVNHTMSDLSQYWLDNALPILNRNKLTMWADIVVGEHGVPTVPSNIILQSWLGSDGEVKNLTSQGYDVILSPLNFLYLDCGSGSSPGNDPRYYETEENNAFNYGTGGSWCGPYKTWQRIYNWDLLSNLTSDEANRVLGAEATVWTEMIDSKILTSIIWPRTASLSELLWSGNRDPITGYLRTHSFFARILNFRQYLVSLGHNARPLVPQYCFQDIHACELHLNPHELDRFGKFFYKEN